MSNYLTELSIIHIALILGYWLFLRNEQQYGKMRFYLLGSTLLALIIPLFKLPKLFFNNNQEIVAVPTEAISLDDMTFNATAELSTWNYDLLVGVYITISIFFLFKFLSSVRYLINLERNSRYEKYNELSIRKVPNIQRSFTFFNWIFLSDEIDQNQEDYGAILMHEKAHVAFGHTFDLLFFELFKVCFWWLPTSWFLNNEIKKIHEYQADAYALKSYSIDHYSSILISSTLKTNGLSLASSFHDGLIFKRLIAMKQQTKKVSPWKFGALSSICMILFVVFACTEDGKLTSNIDDELFTVVEDLPQYPGGMGAFYGYLQNELTYPLEARKAGVEGRVFIEFVVDKDGSLSNVKAVKGIGAGCEDEAVRILQSTPSFKPASQRGKAVRVRMVVPIIFKLGDKTNDDNSRQGAIAVEEVQYVNIDLKVDATYANGEWYGTVYDEDGKAMPGANIVVAGTTSGTVSDLDGTFKVKANVSNDIYVSFVGYQTVKLE